MNEINNTIDQSIQEVLFNRYPAEAVRQLEQLQTDQMAEILVHHTVSKTIKIWERISPQLAAKILEELPVAYAAELLKQIDPNRGASILLSIMDVHQSYSNFLLCVNFVFQFVGKYNSCPMFGAYTTLEVTNQSVLQF